MAKDEKVIHFGYFVRWQREQVKRISLRRLAAAAELSERRLIDIEKMPEPVSYGQNLAKLGAALGVEDLDSAWRNTPVPVPRRKLRRGRSELAELRERVESLAQEMAVIRQHLGIHPIMYDADEDRRKHGERGPRSDSSLNSSGK